MHPRSHNCVVQERENSQFCGVFRRVTIIRSANLLTSVPIHLAYCRFRQSFRHNPDPKVPLTPSSPLSCGDLSSTKEKRFVHEGSKLWSKSDPNLRRHSTRWRNIRAGVHGARQTHVLRWMFRPYAESITRRAEARLTPAAIPK